MGIVNTMSPCQYHKSMSILRDFANNISQEFKLQIYRNKNYRRRKKQKYKLQKYNLQKYRYKKLQEYRNTIKEVQNQKEINTKQKLKLQKYKLQI